MYKARLLIIPIVLFATTTICHAKEPIKFTSAFFRMIQGGKISEAYDQLFEGSLIPDQKPQAVNELKKQTTSGLPMYGKIIGIEKLREEKIGTSITRLVYILKSELHPTIWEFYFYKPKDTWFLTNVIFNDQFQSIQKLQ